MLEQLSVLVPVLLAISLASERLISIIQTIFPWLQQEHKTPAGEVDARADRWRQLTLQVLSIVTSYVGVALAFGHASLLYKVTIGTTSYPVAVLSILGSFGSAFWKNILAYLKAVKDIKTTEKARATLRYHEAAKKAGKVATGSGIVADTTATAAA